MGDQSAVMACDEGKGKEDRKEERDEKRFIVSPLPLLTASKREGKERERENNLLEVTRTVTYQRISNRKRNVSTRLEEPAHMRL